MEGRVGASVGGVVTHSFSMPRKHSPFPVGAAQAANTLLNTHLSASLSGLCWVFLTYREDSCFHVTDVMNGAFAGLAGITPGSGFVNSQVHTRTEQMIGVHSCLWYTTVCCTQLYQL